MSKLCQTFQSPDSFHKRPQTILFHTQLPILLSEYLKTYSFFWIFLCRNSSLTKTTDSYSFLLKKYLIVVNLFHITLSLSHARFRSLAAIINFREMIFCGRASWTQNSCYIAMFSFKKRPKIENLSVFYCLLMAFLDRKVSRQT